MKTSLKLKCALMSLLAVTALTACGSASLPSAMSSSVSGSDGSTLSTLALDGSSADASAVPGQRPGGRGGKGGPGMGGPGGHAGPGGFGFLNPRALADLDLSDEQKTQLEALQTEAKAFMEANKPAAPSAAPDDTDREAARTAFEAAFKSDDFDASDLNANRPARPEPSEAMIDFQVDQIVKLHDILTVEQRAKLVAEPTDAPSDRPSPPADLADKQTERLDKLATELSLSDDQKSQLSALFSSEASARQSEMEARKTAHDAERAAFVALITADTIDRDALEAAIKAGFDKQPDGDDHAAQLVAIHDILNADQRAQWLELNQGGPGGFGGKGGPGMGGPGGHGGRGGHGGPGFGAPGAQAQ